MEIYLLRHGIAEDQRPGMKDPERALTAEGKKKLREVLQVAKTAGVKPRTILTSPFRRALETAEIAADVFDYKDDLVLSTHLTPMSDVRDTWVDIKTHKGAAQLLLASHEPLTGLLTGFLLGAPSLAVDVKKGALIRVDVQSFGLNPRGVLKWMLTPKLANG